MKRRKMHKWNFTFAGIGGVIGMTIGQLLVGNLNFGGILGSLTALLLVVGIDVARMRFKKDKTPDFDERTVKNMLKFYAYAANIFIALLFIGLGIISFMNIESVAVFYLMIPFAVYFLLSGVGALIVSRK
ncbi:hypothetical protein [Oceanobacillus profundus]|uniref:DUF2178 domain-containing protein n=1 Tax=Oceanobacillus profundus TaxID=372463 RepID=A0A417YLN2_9BACI|nr:hypothetical protein [Oceanobacillus profundus]MBR3118661.1 hypothetical protein [Oceanobacillus sp.]MCM3399410.1 hypothetical protein [Oceanobacillus profundus]MDO6450233.1 hypothetical protein [Oceanobacillus profundus]RHW34370.1 hypothetical protein D1B32_04170 [Oceanobacillus profundus]